MIVTFIFFGGKGYLKRVSGGPVDLPLLRLLRVRIATEELLPTLARRFLSLGLNRLSVLISV